MNNLRRENGSHQSRSIRMQGQADGLTQELNRPAALGPLDGVHTCGRRTAKRCR
jgi:hypothetical protein